MLRKNQVGHKNIGNNVIEAHKNIFELFMTYTKITIENLIFVFRAIQQYRTNNR